MYINSIIKINRNYCDKQYDNFNIIIYKQYYNFTILYKLTDNKQDINTLQNSVNIYTKCD